MAVVRFTKIELARLQKKQALFKKYLPTLQLKKMLLQIEVNKAKESLKLHQEAYVKEKKIIADHAKIFTDPAFFDFQEELEIANIDLFYENIAGLEVPHLNDITFKESDRFLLSRPFWADEALHMLRILKKSRQRMIVSKERKELLENELRTVSIRVNLFEKRLIPEIEKDIAKIRVFLGDQDLQAIGGAKVSKKKILARMKDEEDLHAR